MIATAAVLSALACLFAGFAAGTLAGPWRNHSERASVGCVTTGIAGLLVVLSVAFSAVWFVWFR
jgi:hypothetical protein